MKSALVVSTSGSGAPDLAEDLKVAGFPIIATAESETLVQMAIKHAPDIIVCYETRPTYALFSSISLLNATLPRPVVLFTDDSNADTIERATQAGVHAYIVDGYASRRLRSIVQVALARFGREATLRSELTSVSKRFAERKLVDRAKGILMRAHRISEDQAFRALRTAAMHTKLRVGQVSQQIIEAAHYAQAVNRAGQLRMFSQRIVTLYALLCADVRVAESQLLLRATGEAIETTLTSLGQTLSRATFGDLLDGVSTPWRALKKLLKETPRVGKLRALDRSAETLLDQSEQLVTNLEIAGLSQSLHVINVAGRQRMLSQRIAKQALLINMLPASDPDTTESALHASRGKFSEAQAYLHAIPLATPTIADYLRTADRLWAAFQDALGRADTADGRREIAELSEALVAVFDLLTEHYELGMAMLMK